MTTPPLFSNKLSDAQAERLAILMEEMAEACQVIGKILRHGYRSCHPNNLGGPDNRRLLEIELGHVDAAMALMEDREDVDRREIAKARYSKVITMKPFLHHQGHL